MINTAELKEVMNQLYTIVPKRTSMPILQTVLMQSNGHRVKMMANNLEEGLVLYLNTDLQIDCCLPAKQLNETVKLLTAPEINIKTYPDENKIIIQKKPGQSTIRTLSSDEFPVIELPENTQDTFAIDSITVANALKKALISASTDISHPVLNGVLLKSSNNVLEVCGVDGFRMTMINLLFGLPDFEVIIPYNAVSPMVKILEQQNKANILVNQNKVVLWNDNFIFTSQLVAGNYPDVKRLIQHEWKTQILVDKSVLANAVKQALVYAVDADNLIHFNIDSEQLVVSGISSSMGDDKTPITQIEFSGEPLEIALNGRFLYDALALAKDKLVFKFNGPFNPVGVFIPENELITHILMPMHLGRQ